MKRLAAYILLLIYFTVSTGFVVSVHYCMNKVDSIKLGDDSSEECGKCGMHLQESNGCCKDDVKMVKMQVDQAFAKIVALDFSFIRICLFTLIIILLLFKILFTRNIH